MITGTFTESNPESQCSFQKWQNGRIDTVRIRTFCGIIAVIESKLDRNWDNELCRTFILANPSLYFITSSSNMQAPRDAFTHRFMCVCECVGPSGNTMTRFCRFHPNNRFLPGAEIEHYTQEKMVKRIFRPNAIGESIY